MDRVSAEKSPGLDGIAAEIRKCAKSQLKDHLYALFIECWGKWEVPQGMRDSNIITLDRNKADRSDCNNYRGISLLSMTGQLFGCILLKRLQILAERIYPDSQCGSRLERSTVGTIFSLRQLHEKFR